MPIRSTITPVPNENAFAHERFNPGPACWRLPPSGSRSQAEARTERKPTREDSLLAQSRE